MPSPSAPGHPSASQQSPPALLGWSPEASCGGAWGSYPTASPNTRGQPLPRGKAENTNTVVIPGWDNRPMERAELHITFALCLMTLGLQCQCSRSCRRGQISPFTTISDCKSVQLLDASPKESYVGAYKLQAGLSTEMSDMALSTKGY